ncbi:NHLP leader peptide family RiPP precursor [Microcystis aeruginosa CS-1036]|uniref:NHLP leader peptide family RiPP precursor n=1 Tax=Microcystis TaxID=1125 RepID=UPI00233023B4|nr:MULTISPECIES: NHLP leader peptide family RiPP precursor [Microcystis]MDB9405989.1 NHLP leader peptide family RiPP precursor [Microcystis sp. CS-574]MDB9544952.1 NHLP leader peptide family RiPP precursor [Microcystis aeruginosa CS-1036]
MNNFDEMPKKMTPNLPLWSFQLQPNSKLALKTRKDLEIHLITRALKDEEFKRELIANPKAVIERELGTKLPDELEINVLEETEDTIYMVLPCNPYEGISEEELKASLGITYEDVAKWVSEQQRNTLLDETSSILVISRAWKDEGFKQELLKNPKRTLTKELEITIPDSLDIQVISETPNALYLVLPIISDQHTSKDLYDALSEGELEAVAGAYRELIIASTHIYTGGCCITNPSDRNLKANFSPVDSKSVLEKVAALPIETWNYKSQNPTIRHIGPMAQDFHAAFSVGEDDKHINTVDADGVALAAIKGLYQLIKEKDAQIAKQQSQITDLETKNQNLEFRLATLELAVKSISTSSSSYKLLSRV